MEITRALDENIQNMRRMIIPSLGTQQLVKNPFIRYSHIDSIPKPQSNILFTSKIPISSIHHANSICITKTMEVLDPDSTSNLNDDKHLTKFQDHKDREDGKTEEVKFIGKFKLTMNKEIEHNFNIMKCLRLASIEEVKAKEIKIPVCTKQKDSDKTLILDLDDTLFHSLNPAFDYSYMNIAKNEIRTIKYMNNVNKRIEQLQIIIRPYAIELLEKLSKIYEIIVIIDQINRYLHHLRNLMLMLLSIYWILIMIISHSDCIETIVYTKVDII